MTTELTDAELVALENEYPVLANLRLASERADADRKADYEHLPYTGNNGRHTIAAVNARNTYLTTARILAGLDD